MGKSKHFHKENSHAKCGRNKKKKMQAVHFKTEVSPQRSSEAIRKASEEKKSNESVKL